MKKRYLIFSFLLTSILCNKAFAELKNTEIGNSIQTSYDKRIKQGNRYISFDEIVQTNVVAVCQEPHFCEEFSQAHNFLMEQIKQGKPIYGVTTGYGASGKNYLTYEQSEILQENLYRFHGCGVDRKSVV